MIPLQIKLRNFLSYGDYTQTISFEPYHLICLSGKNGHGKSALLDAITWSLWGQARKTLATAKADEGLLRLGQTHMMVTFDFLCNGMKYRVQREFVAQQKTTHTDLYFGVAATKEGDTFTSLTEKTTRATQEKIVAMLGLSYESCINSIFLRQGQSNEFSSKSAKERKDILATILGINRYEEIRAKAQEKIRNLTAAQEQLTTLIQRSQETIKEKQTLQEQHILTEHEIVQLATQHKKNLSDFEQTEQATKELHQKLQQKLVHETRLQSTQELFTQKNKLLLAARDAVRSLRQKISVVPCAQSQKEKLLAQDALYHQQREELFTLKELLLKQQTELAQENNKLTARYHEELLALTATAQKHEQQLQQLTAQQAGLQKESTEKEKLRAEHQKTTTNLQKLSLTEKIQKQEAHFERRKQFYHSWIDRGNRLNQLLKELQQKKALGEGVTSVTCPLCEQALSSTRKRFLIDKFIDQEVIAAHQKNRLADLVPALKEVLIQHHAALTALKQQQELLQQATAALEKLTSELATVQKNKNEGEKNLQAAQSDYDKAHAQQLLFQKNRENYFAADAVFKAVTQNIAELQKKSATHDYNQKKHDEVKELLAQIKKQEELQQHHAEYRAQHEQEKKNFFQLCAELKIIRQQKKSLMQELAAYASLAEQEKFLQQQKTTLEQQQKVVAQKTLELHQKKSALEQQLKAMAEREQELAQYQKELQESADEADDYQMIAQALGKNGIQALLIERAIPELEHEANALLTKLTDNQSHIMIESVRDLKSGGFKETLDIKISDAVGTRPYELFSGGEAFRIDFALRIALSKLLARRSGTSLQTLIIDEGFGSQDEEGLARIMESLYKIQDDFAKIIIVSHLPEMKNQFPIHFFVHKGATGSQITVFEQG